MEPSVHRWQILFEPLFSHCAGILLLYFYVFWWNEDLGGGVPLVWNIIQRVTFIFGIYQHPPSTLMPDWSIALEMQFYLFFPFLMLFVRKIGIVPLVILSAVICWLFKLVYGVYGEPGLWGSYDQPTILPLKFTLFTYGMLIACVFYKRTSLSLYVYLLLALLCALPFKHGHSWLVLGLLGLALTVNMLPLAGNWWRVGLNIADRFCDNRFFTWLADISYGLYLMHPFVLIALRDKLHDTGMSYGAWANWLIILTTALLILVPLTTLSYYLIEKPCIRLGRRLTARVHPLNW